MKPHSNFHFVFALITAAKVISAPTNEFGLERKTVWQNVGRHSFYGPWSISVKRNGDYIDYNDYGVHFEQFQPNSLELLHDDVSIANGYIDAMRPAYDNGLPKPNERLDSIGLVDFRTGVQPADWIDRNSEKRQENIASH